MPNFFTEGKIHVKRALTFWFGDGLAAVVIIQTIFAVYWGRIRINPHVRYRGKASEEATMFIDDLFVNSLEVK